MATKSEKYTVKEADYLNAFLCTFMLGFIIILIPFGFLAGIEVLLGNPLHLTRDVVLESYIMIGSALGALLFMIFVIEESKE